MSLLNDLFARPLDPGYEEAAKRREAEGDQPPSTARKFRPALLIGVLALGLLFTAGVLQVRNSATVVTAERESLIDRIRGAEMHAQNLQESVAALESEIETLEDRQLQNSTTGQQLRDELQQLQAVAGTVAVTGPGIVVSLDDAPAEESVDDPDLARVLDIDVQQVVNGLWQAGAEAVAVNGQRVTPLSAIRSVDFVIQVNYRPLAPPYEISAVGDDRTMASRFSEGPGGQWLRAAAGAGLEYAVHSEDDLDLPAGSTSLDYAKPKEDS